MHDALIRGVDYNGSDLDLLCRAGNEQRGYVDGWIAYGNVTVSVADERFLKSAVGRADFEMLYGEFDSSDASDARWVHRLLFWPYHEIAVHFETLRLTITVATRRFDPSTPSD